MVMVPDRERSLMIS